MMDLFIDPLGTVTCLYSEDLPLHSLGSLSIRRASHVEPDLHAQWWADLSPSGGPRLGPFSGRQEALDAEHDWLIDQQLQSSLVS